MNPRQFQVRVAALPDLNNAGGRTPVVWLMDIDGVLNIVTRGRPPLSEWADYRMGTSIFEGFEVVVVYSPALVALLNELHRKRLVSFRWLTTWHWDGPQKFAPSVGLDIGSWIAAEELDDERWWKLQGFEEHYAENSDRLVIWTDDDIPLEKEALMATAFLPADDALIIYPDSHVGLSLAEFDVILSGIEQAVERFTGR